MIALSFDQSLTSTACVILECSESYVRIIRQGVYQPKSKGIHRLIAIQAWMDSIIRGANANLMFREMHNQSTFGAGNAIHALAGFLDVFAYSGNFLDGSRYGMIPSTSWKKFVVGKGNVAKDTGYLMTINKCLKSSPWFKHSPDFEVVNDNIADAICIGICGYASWRYHIQGISDGLNKPQTEVMKKSASMFDYGN